MADILYIRLKKNIKILPETTVALKDIADLYVENQSLFDEIREIKVFKHQQREGNRVVIEALHIIKVLREKYTELQLEVIGESHTLVMVESARGRRRPFVFVLCWLILFFGSGLAIMNFHSDVNMYETQVRIVELLTGEYIERPLWFQIPYSVGIGVGMLLFFNYRIQKRKTEEPNPLEVEMYLYQENVNQYVIADEIKRSEER